jgi:hypothetical protein
MNDSKSNNANVQLLTCLVEPQDTIDPDDSHYRVLVDRNYVKYVTILPGTLAGEEQEWTFRPILLSELLPPFPPGNWNKGYVAKDPERAETGEAALHRDRDRVPCQGGKRLASSEAERVGFRTSGTPEATSSHFNTPRT